MIQYRQGDVFVVAIDEFPADVTRVVRDRGRIVLAYGEVTGHAHAILDRHAVLYASPDEVDRRFLEVLAEGGVDLVHEEHSTITLPAGRYEVRIQREYRPEGIVRVVD